MKKTTKGRIKSGGGVSVFNNLKSKGPQLTEGAIRSVKLTAKLANIAVCKLCTGILSDLKGEPFSINTDEK